MSRIGKLPVVFNDKTEVSITNNTIKIKWALWELYFNFSNEVTILKSENQLLISPIEEKSKAIWWTTRAVINNMVIWVNEWFKKSLEINWVGYKFEVSWSKLILSIGFSHKVEVEIPSSLKVQLDEKLKNLLHISWIDKQLVWEFSAKIRSMKKPEPYKGKWIKYLWEQIRRKAGKTGSK